ncbi:DNA-processing protein DprA [Gillisia sp. M10.2A]|uniref:DNA-processing protein DprA n=1 Tax=Gillisia lutea TaxID=2909668 RepID=A0ABS9ECS8_9FLAO|nr:DNA-processing protein DprA [Gillisia lutea]MCF4100686.1 DNA-processing protein DprA [Gillisia lutea]
MDKIELLHLMALQNVPNLGDSTAKKLIRHVGSAEAVFKAKKESLLKIDGIGKMKLQSLHLTDHLKAAEKELSYIEKNTISVCSYKDNVYPDKLKHCNDGPLVLYSRGNIDLQKRKILSIVGTRKVTSYGIGFCERLVEELAPLNPVIISGFAYGVDITAHRAAIKHNLQTIGCLAHGLNQIYPKVHAKYMGQMEENGGFFTDFWSSKEFDRNNFLKRNRIIAGLSEATLVVESAEKGGSLVTADIANSYDREVFAVPGRATDVQSKGCNDLIKDQKAHLVASAADIIYMLNWEVPSAPKVVQKRLFMELSPVEQEVYDKLKNEGKQELDVIALKCKMPTFKTAGILLDMELKGAIRPLPGKLFEVI